MQKTFSAKFKKQIVTIFPGEFFVSREDELIGTLLGSCIAVCLHDPSTKTSGMNHYMLEGQLNSLVHRSTTSDKHALQSISRLIECMCQKGCRREDMQAKIFGGGKVLQTDTNVHTVPQDNIRAAKLIMEMEDIPIIQEETGGKFTRKLLFEVHTGKTFVKRSVNSNLILED